jgi:hypothetical protein
MTAATSAAASSTPLTVITGSQSASSHWGKFPELDALPHLSGNGENHEYDCSHSFDIGTDCDCGTGDMEELLCDNIHENTYFPPINGFTPTWERAVGRWTIGWFEVRKASKEGDNGCLSSSVRSLSPFSSS